ncbi:unnamed protein product [Mytilus edulis]|uniref:Uncharacterized protein n=1 Tax=Mytilus edulis TaxID=6550 RepID=A0A8S3RYU2_MYTED|nr:unnamed protein product [Mytilus edulis]
MTIMHLRIACTSTLLLTTLLQKTINIPIDQIPFEETTNIQYNVTSMKETNNTLNSNNSVTINKIAKTSNMSTSTKPKTTSRPKTGTNNRDMELHGFVTELEQKLKDQEKTIKLLQKKDSLTNKTQNSSYHGERHIQNSMDPSNQNQQTNQNSYRIDPFNIYERMHQMEIQALESRIRAIEVQSTQNLSICSALTTQMALQLQQSMATMNHQIRQLNQQHQFTNPQPAWNQHTNVNNPGPHLFQQQNQYLNPQPTWTPHTNFNNPGPYSFQQHPNIHLFPQPPAYQFTRPPPNIQHTRQLFPPYYNAMHHPPQDNIVNNSNPQRNDHSRYAASSTKTPHPNYNRQINQIPKNLSDDSHYQEKPVQKELNKAKTEYKSDQTERAEYNTNSILLAQSMDTELATNTDEAKSPKLQMEKRNVIASTDNSVTTSTNIHQSPSCEIEIKQTTKDTGTSCSVDSTPRNFLELPGLRKQPPDNKYMFLPYNQTTRD